MRSSALFCGIVTFALVVTVVTLSTAGSVSAAAPHHATRPSLCGAPDAAHTMVEPPNVDVSALPLNADGEHELILAVHSFGRQFCYRYRWDGAVLTTAPTIRVHRGDHFAMRIVNDIAWQSKGERVSSREIPQCMPMPMPDVSVAHYVGYLNHTIDDRHTSMLPIDTNVHLHGFIGPPEQEDIFLSTLSTPMHACEYRITIPLSQPFGTYFYHPHAHGISDVQVAFGLSGAWIVEPAAPQLPRSADHVILLKYHLPVLFDNAFVLDDSAISIMGAVHEAALRPAAPVAYDPFNPPPWPITYPMTIGDVTEDGSGCNGLDSEPIVSVDGSHPPAELEVPAGQAQLLRIVNATSDSPKALRLHDSLGRNVPMHIVGRDGTPVAGDTATPLSGYIPMNEVLLAPFSRADALVTVSPGETLTLSSEHFCGGADAFFQMHHDLLHITAASATAAPSTVLASSPVNVADTPAAKLVAFARAHPSRIHRRAITFTEYSFPSQGKGLPRGAFYVTDTTDTRFREHPFWPSYAPGATVPSKADVVVKAGTIEEWYLINTTMEAHAFHIHQMAFVEERSAAGVPLTEDSVFVPVGKLLPNPRDPNYPLVRPKIVKLLLDFRHVPRGTFVFHCHMLFHEDRGMMAVVRVE